MTGELAVPQGHLAASPAASSPLHLSDQPGRMDGRPRRGPQGHSEARSSGLSLRRPWLSSSEAAPDSVISLQPPWPITFQGQEVTLTCHGSSFESPGQTTWFHLHQDNKTSRRTPGSTWVVRESGQYRCQAGRSRPSSPVHLTFSRGKTEGKRRGLRTPYGGREMTLYLLNQNL